VRMIDLSELVDADEEDLIEAQISYQFTRIKGPVFLLYEKSVHQILTGDLSDSRARVVIRKFYDQVYMEYLDESKNKRFFLMVADSFGEYCSTNETGKDFAFKWLLRQSTRAATDQEQTRSRCVYLLPWEMMNVDDYEGAINNKLKRYVFACLRDYYYWSVHASQADEN
jgi:hypothetical protein